MPIDMKETIADTVRRMLVEKRVKKLTVKEIVEECHITRQTFYYHFEDIPDMFRWMLKGSNDEVVARCEELPDMESRLRYLFLVALNAEPYVKQSLKTNYAEEIEASVEEVFWSVIEHVAVENGLYGQYSAAGSCAGPLF